MANSQVQVNLAVSADTSQAKAQLQNLQKQLTDLAKSGAKNDTSLGLSKELQKSIDIANKLKIALQNSTNSAGKIDLSKFNDSLSQLKIKVGDIRESLAEFGPAGDVAFNGLANSLASAEAPLFRCNQILNDFGNTLKNTAKWQISSSIIHGLQGGLQQAFSYAENLNESLTNIRIVTGASSEEMAKFAEQANRSAQALSTTTTEYTNAALIFYQQGLNAAEVKERTDATMKMAQATGDSATQVSSYMTAIWNNFDDGSKSLEHYADVITALGASTASSSSEISEGLSKFAAIAKTTGLSYEYATASLATLVANTRESADTLGNSLKTIFSRLQGLKLGETLEDGVDLNKYSAALKTVGVDVLTANDDLRDMDDILADLGEKWNMISDAQKIALAQTVAGVRQYSTLMALMNNQDDLQKNLETARNADGTLNNQAEIYAQSWEASQKRVKAALESIYSSLIDDNFFIGLNDGLTVFLKLIDDVIQGFGGVSGVITTLSSLILNVFNKQIASGLDNAFLNLKSFATLMKNTAADLPVLNKVIKKSVPEDEKTVRSILGGEVGNLVDSAVEKQSNAELGDSYKRVAEARLLYAQSAKELTDIQRESLNMGREYISQLDEEIKKYTEIRDKATQAFESIKQKTLDLVDKKGGNSNEVNTAIENYRTASQQERNTNAFQTRFEDIISSEDGENLELYKERFAEVFAEIEAEVEQTGQKLDQVLNKKYGEETATKILELKKDLEEGKISAEEFANRLEEITALNRGKAKTAQDQMAESIVRNTKSMKAAGQAVEELTQAEEREGQAQEHVQKATLNQIHALEAYKKAINDLKDSQSATSKNITNMAGGMMSLASASNSIKGAFDILSDSSKNVFERMTSGIMSVSMSILSLLQGVQKLSQSFPMLAAAAPWLAVGAAVIGVVNGINSKIENDIKKSQQKAQESLEDAKKAASEIDNVRNDTKIIQDNIDNMDGTVEAKQRLIESLEEIAEKYDIEDAAILVQIGKYDELIDKIHQVREEKAKEKEKDLEDARADAETALEDTARGKWDDNAGYYGNNFVLSVAATHSSTEEGFGNTILKEDSVLKQAISELQSDEESYKKLGAEIEYVNGEIQIRGEKSAKGIVNTIKTAEALQKQMYETAKDTFGEGSKELTNFIKNNDTYNDLGDFIEKTEEQRQTLEEVQDAIIDNKIEGGIANFFEDIENVSDSNSLADFIERTTTEIAEVTEIDKDKVRAAVEAYIENYTDQANRLQSMKYIDSQLEDSGLGEDQKKEVQGWFDEKNKQDGFEELSVKINLDLVDKSDIEGSLDSQLKSLQAHANAEKILVNLDIADNARKEYKDKMTSKDYAEFESKSGLKWGETMEGLKDPLIKYTDFLAMKDEEQKKYLDSIYNQLAEYANGVEEILSEQDAAFLTSLENQRAIEENIIKVWTENTPDENDENYEAMYARYVEASRKILEINKQIEDLEQQTNSFQSSIEIRAILDQKELEESLAILSEKEFKINATLNENDIKGFENLFGADWASDLDEYIDIGVDGSYQLVSNASEFNDLIKSAMLSVDNGVITNALEEKPKREDYDDDVIGRQMYNNDIQDWQKNTQVALAQAKSALLSIKDDSTFENLFESVINQLKDAGLWTQEWEDNIRQTRDALDTSKDSVENLSKYLENENITAEQYVSRLIALLDIDSSTGTAEALEQLIEKLRTGEIEAENFQSGINQLLGRAQSLDEKNAIIDKATVQQYDENGKPIDPYTDEQTRHMRFDAAKDSSNKYTSDAARIAQMEGVMADAKKNGTEDEIKQYRRELTETITASDQLSDAQKELKINDLWAGQEGTYEYNMVMIDLIANMKDLTDTERQAKLEALGITEVSPLWEYFNQIINDTSISIKDFSTILKDLKPGESIDQDIFEQLIALAPELKNSFMDMGDGTYTLLTNAEALRTVLLDVYADSKNGDNFAYTNEQLAAQAQTLSELDYLDSKRNFTQAEYLKAEAAIGLQYENAKEESLTLLQLLQEQKILQDEIALLESQENLTNEQQVELERLKTEEKQKQAELESAKVDSDVAIGASESAEQFGMDAQAIEDLAKYYLELAENGDEVYQSLKGNGKAAVDEARQMIRASEACEDLSKNSSKYGKILDGLKGDTKDYTKTLINNSKEIKALKKDVAGILDTTEDYIDTNMLAKLSLEDIQKAAEGDISSLRKLQAEQAKSLGSKNNISEDVTSKFNEAMASKGENESLAENTSTSEFKDANGETQVIKTSLDLDIDPFVRGIAEATIAAGGGAEDLQAALSGIGIEMDNAMFFNSLQEAEDWAAKSNNRVIQNLAIDAKPNATTQTSSGTKDDVGFNEEIHWSQTHATSNVLKDGDDKATPVQQTYWVAQKVVTPNKVSETEETDAPVVAVGYENPHTGSSAGGNVKPSGSGGGGRGGGRGGGSNKTTPRRATALRRGNATHNKKSNLTQTLNNSTNAYNKLNKASEQAFGKSKLQNMELEIKKQEEIIKKTQQLTAETKKLAEAERNRISEEGKGNQLTAYYVEKDTKGNETSKRTKFNISDFLGKHTEKEIVLDANGNAVTKGGKVQTKKKKYENLLTFDEYGNLKNEDAITARLDNQQARLQAAVDAYSTLKENNPTKLKAEAELAKFQAQRALIEEELNIYKQDIEDYWNSVEQEIEGRLEKEAKELEKTQYQLEIKLKVNDNELEVLERTFARFEKISIPVTFDLAGETTNKDNKNSNNLFTNLKNQIDKNYGKIQNEEDHIKEILKINGASDSEIDNFLKTGEIKGTWAAFLNPDEMKELDSSKSEILSLSTEIENLDDQILQLTGTITDQWLEAMDKQNAKVESGLSTLEHYANVIDIVGKKKLKITDSDLYNLRWGTVDQKQVLARNAKDRYELTNDSVIQAQKSLENLKSQWNKNYKNLSDEEKEHLKEQISVAEQTYNEAVEKSQEALQNWESAVEDALTAAKEAFEATSEDIQKTLTDPFETILMQNERNKNKKEGFNDETTGLYELAKLTKDINKSLDDAQNVRSKEAMAKVLDKVNKAKERSNELSEYETEELRKEYELELARQKLEEARNAKSEVRLTRDSEGNFSYVYTADNSAMEEAESEYEDKLQELYELNRDYIDEMRDKMLELPQEMADAIAELDEKLMNNIIDKDEYDTEMDKIKKYYDDRIEAYQKEIDLALTNQSDLYDKHYQALAEKGRKIAKDSNFIDSWDELKDALDVSGPVKNNMNTLDAFADYLKDNFNKASEEAKKNANKIDEENTETLQDEGTLDANGKYVGKNGKSNLNEAIKDVADEASKTEKAINTLAKNGKADIEEFGNTIANWSNKAVENFEKIAKAVTGTAKSVKDLNETLTNNTGISTLNGNFDQLVSKYKNDSQFYNKETKDIHAQNILSQLSGGGATREEMKTILEKIINNDKNLTLDGEKIIDINKAIEQALKRAGFDTGGYTGEWTDGSGKLAMLHSKELVLNKEDTKNILDAVSMVREISNAINLNALTAQSNLFSLFGNSIPTANHSDKLEQYVTITLDAPNLTDKNSAMEIFDNVINLASQYAYKH